MFYFLLKNEDTKNVSNFVIILFIYLDVGKVCKVFPWEIEIVTQIVTLINKDFLL